MTRIPKTLKPMIVAEFQNGRSMELLAERLRVALWQIEQVIREALKKGAR